MHTDNPLEKNNQNFKFCPGCKLVFPRDTSAFFRNNARPDKLSVRCKLCHQRATGAITEDLRSELLHSLGGKCVRCGIDDQRVLQIDHINGGGTAERKKFSPVKYYELIKEFGSSRYQILCANCNVIKRFEQNEHCRREIQFPDPVAVTDLELESVQKRKQGGQDYAVIAQKVKATWTPERRTARAEQMRKIRAEKKWSTRSTRES